LGDNADAVLHPDASVMKVNRKSFKIFIIAGSLQLAQEALVNVWKLLQPGKFQFINNDAYHGDTFQLAYLCFEQTEFDGAISD
jgi:hypothetical protein